MKCIVVGSGPSGANAALTLLRRGKTVELWDVGEQESVLPHPEADFHGLKQVLDDPQDYFLGRRFEALLAPDGEELLRYPPARSFLLDERDDFWPYASTEFRPFVSHARGGLGLGWGVNALSFDEDDIRDWPVAISALREAYAEAGRRIPVSAAEDGLSPFFPGIASSQPPVRVSAHDAKLLANFTRRAARIERWCHVSIARGRLAVVNDERRDEACRYCGRCLWGCPHGSLYSPEQTLRECGRYPGFGYKPGRLVLSLDAREGRITHIRWLDTGSRRQYAEPCDAVFLAAGALASGGIFLRTLTSDADRPPAERTRSVMDTTVVKIPYVRLASVGDREEGGQFQFNRLIIAHRKPRQSWPAHVHGEVLSLNTLLYHRLIESIPLGSRLAMKAFARLRGALGVVTYFFPDRQVDGNGLSVQPDPSSPTGDRLLVHYREEVSKEALIRETVRDTRRALALLGCVAARPIRSPVGAGIHYAGTVPMGEGPLCCDSEGRANAYRNLFLCDGAAFPSLPSKSITLNLVAHAIRVTTLASA